jgi:hypothetical protein
VHAADSISTATKMIYRKQQRTAVAAEAPSSACPRYIPLSLFSGKKRPCGNEQGTTPIVAWRPDPNHGVEGRPQRRPWQRGPGPWCGVDGRCPGKASLARPLAERRPGRVAWAGLGCHLALMASDLSSFAPLAVEWLYSATALWA